MGSTTRCVVDGLVLCGLDQSMPDVAPPTMRYRKEWDLQPDRCRQEQWHLGPHALILLLLSLGRRCHRCSALTAPACRCPIRPFTRPWLRAQSRGHPRGGGWRKRCTGVIRGKRPSGGRWVVDTTRRLPGLLSARSLVDVGWERRGSRI